MSAWHTGDELATLHATIAQLTARAEAAEADLHDAQAEAHGLQAMWSNMRADCDALAGLLGRAVEALGPFEVTWGALRDPLPQQPFSLSADANAFAAAYRAAQSIRAKLKELY